MAGGREAQPLPTAAPARWRGWPSALRPEEWLALGYAAAVFLLLALRAQPISLAPLAASYGRFLAAILAVTLPIWLAARAVRALRGNFTWRAGAREIAALARPLAALLLTLVAYTNLKSRLAALHPRLFDAALERLDAWVHFGGGDFLGWLLSFAGDPAADRLWAIVYFYAWAALALPFAAAFARAGAPAARRVTAALLAAYAVGSIVYLALPSLGPAFAFRPRYAPLFAGTAGFAVQESMLRAYLELLRHPGAGAVPFFGIAAMPSLHLATTAIGLLAAWRWARPLLVVLIPWNLAIAWSALYFGWHYAVDFYPALAIAAVAWWWAGRIGDHGD